MESKGVRAMIMGLLILGLLVAKIEADKTCCKDTAGADCFNSCMLRGKAPPRHIYCAAVCECLNYQTSCPPTHPISSDGTINDYCKLGCVSSVCDTITTNQNSDVREGEVNEAVEHYCVNACSELCNKGAKTAVASA